MKIALRLIPAVIAVFVLSGCSDDITNSGKVSSATGWEYNKEENGGFEVASAVDQETGPGLVFIEGGTFTMGKVQDDVLYEWNNVPRRVTVASFYMDETEITNVNYREYLYWLDRVFGVNNRQVVINARPDTLVWRDPMAFNEPY
ncbi:MAG: formylglycine-generating enzyme family protein, partial [Bacteroidales bacterium]|nr:formylglycine-generating enzyme family protein [Bacteroidales bacterium]